MRNYRLIVDFTAKNEVEADKIRNRVANEFYERWDFGADVHVEPLDAVEEVVFDKEIPPYGDLMTRDEWISNVENNAFIDYDGFCHPSNGEKLNWMMIRPSEKHKLPLNATHVVWFNR